MSTANKKVKRARAEVSSASSTDSGPLVGGDAQSLASGPSSTPVPAPPSARPRTPRAVPVGWRVLEAEPLPRATAWPGALAFAVTFLLWGIVSSPFISGVGVLLFAISIAGWIGDIRNEARSHH